MHEVYKLGAKGKKEFVFIGDDFVDLFFLFGKDSISTDIK